MNGQQLKNSILQLAIQGRLVPQDSKDEPASALLKRIREEKKRLVEEKKIKKEKPLAPIRDEEKPFDIPDSWEWVRLGEICNLIMGQSPNGENINTINGIEFHQGKIAFGDLYLKESGVYTISPCKIAEPYSILLCVRAPVGIPNITTRKISIGRGLCALSTIEDIPILFVFYFILGYQRYFEEKATGSTFKAISMDVVSNAVVPLPPLAEQHRIVEKIEELLPLVEEYNEAQKKLDKLNDDLPEMLKKSVLQQAIMGKLDTRNDDDEPASVLLKRIKVEKAKLIKEKKLKKEKPLAPITDDEKPFDIPESWEWVRLGEIANLYIGKTPERSNPLFWNDGKYPWISISDMREYGFISSTKECISTNAASTCFKRISQVGSLIMSFKLTVGRTSILNVDAYHNEAIVTIERCCDDNNFIRDFLFYTLPILANMGDSKDAIKGKTLNSTSLNNLIIPLPPLAEQHRIVEKIEEILPLIDEMKKT